METTTTGTTAAPTESFPSTSGNPTTFTAINTTEDSCSKWKCGCFTTVKMNILALKRMVYHVDEDDFEVENFRGSFYQLRVCPRNSLRPYRQYKIRSLNLWMVIFRIYTAVGIVPGARTFDTSSWNSVEIYPIYRLKLSIPVTILSQPLKNRLGLRLYSMIRE